MCACLKSRHQGLITPPSHLGVLSNFFLSVKNEQVAVLGRVGFVGEFLCLYTDDFPAWPGPCTGHC